MSNYSIYENITKVEDLVTHVNSSTDGLYALVGLFLVWLILFTGFKKYRTPEAFAGASFVTGVVASVMFFAGLVTETYLAIGVLLIVISIFMLGRGRG